MLEVHLRPLVMSDLARVLEWSRDEAFCLANGWPVGLPAEQLQDWFVRLLNNPPVDLVRRGIVVTTPAYPAGHLVGFVDLRELNPLEKRARLRVAIGEEAHRGQGVGYAAGLKMLEQGFAELGLERITARVHSSNTRMRSLLEKMGFVLEGILRQHETRQGIKEDVYLYGMLREEFRPPEGIRLLESAQ
ncbi:MAG: GNAT family N-acetyltransferase [Meiothermus sp.]|uniref:GNAT family N-acetyltransferase n=1 Tax=Meiothermus sp. TaxID=1955249 RepID=UPI0025D9EC8A|nr:GNAT family protein [Meiothermus sp.]MCS7068060.1 GNAT family N-acetyltransferase [Meiothermus sp.]MCX7600443.1 GNAT family N-acetyltransferase [Meiothermus sp.]MDW8425145.1 GNAT family protein [Meiothermus sp.]